MPTPEEILEARRRARVGQAKPGTSVQADRPAPRSTTPLPQQESEGSRLGGLFSRLTSPLVDVPDLPGGFLGDIAERGLEELSSPLGIAMAALTPVTGGASLGLKGALGAGARIGTRMGAEAAVGGAASTVASEVSERLPEDMNPLLKGGISLGAGIAAGVGTARVSGRGVDALPGGRSRNKIPLQQQVTAPDPEVEPFVEALREAKRQLSNPEVRKQLKASRSDELVKRIRKANEHIDPSASADEIQRTFYSHQKGALPALDFPEISLEPETIETLLKRVQQGVYDPSAPLLPFEAAQAKDVLDGIFFDSRMPTRYEMGLLERALGPQVVQALEDLRPFSLGRAFNDVINIPRAVLASMDMSFGMRQGILALGAGPKGFAKGNIAGAKAFASDDYAREIDNLVRGVTGGPDNQVLTNYLNRFGVEFTGSASTPEEAFQAGKLGKALFGSNEAGRIMAASERSFATTGNYLRWNLGTKTLKNMAALYGKQGDSLEEALARIPYAEGKKLAQTVNVMTGRSGLKAFSHNEWGRTLNAFFFAPNYLASRFMAPALLPARVIQQVKANPSLLLKPHELYTQDPILRLQAHALGGFLAQGTLGLAGLKLAAEMGWIPDFNIETDPRSTSFGKGKVGDTEIDFWAGYGPIARAAARLWTGQTKTRAGHERELERRFRQPLWDEFIRSKTSPIAGFAWDAISGTNFIGDKVTYDERGIEKQVVDNLIPLFLQDMMEAYREGGTLSALATTPAFFGVGASTYLTPGQVKDNVSQELFNKPYEELSQAQRQVADQHPRVVEKIAERTATEPHESFRAAVDAINQERMQAEEIIVALARSGQMSRKEMADAIGEQQIRLSAKREELIRQYQIPEPQTNSLLQQALNSWYDLYDLADIGAEKGIKTGKVDWEKFDQLEADLLKTLTQDQIDFIEQRQRAEHSELAQWFFDNRKYITDSGYYEVADEEFAKFASRIQRISPEITSYGGLQIAMENVRYSDPRLYARLNAIENKLSKRISDRREQMRIKNPSLDVALYSIGRTTTLKTRAAQRQVTN